MAGGIILAERASSDIATPASGKITIYPNSGASDALSYKDDAGTVHQLLDSVATGLVIGIPMVIDGGGSAITTGVKLDVTIPFACTITQWTVLLDQSGSIVFDIWKDTYANYPPVVGDSITASAKPTVTTATKGQSSTLTGWTTSVAAGDTLRINVDSITTATRALLSLKATRA